MGEYNACRQRCQLINKASQHRLDSHFAPFTGYPRNNLWSSEAALWCVRGFPMWIALFALLCRVRASNLIFVYCRLEYIKLGSPQDSTWRDFPQALAETQGARRYVTLFEAPFVASELEGRESQALRAAKCFFSELCQELLTGFLVPGLFGSRLHLLSEVCACFVLGNGSERFCASIPLLGSYVHQESMLNKM